MSIDNDDLFSDLNSGNLDPEKYKEQLLKIYKELTGRDLDDEEFKSIFNSMNMTEAGNFLQDLSDDEQKQIFDDFVNDRDMELHIDFEEVLGELMVQETWTSDKDKINLNRMYHYEYLNISKLNPIIQKKIYETRLPILVEQEKFEEAAEVRDILKSLDN